VSGFDPGWLALREPADHAARASSLLPEVAAVVGPCPVVVDLGCGTGSNLRGLAPHLPAAQRWRLVDHDRRLLAEAVSRVPPGTETIVADLRNLKGLPLEGATLVTAAALFDLLSARWFDRFAARLAAKRLPLYAVLTYDGATRWAPPHPLDPLMHEALNTHQRADKGFGPALGPDAPGHMERTLAALGYRVSTADSAWILGPDRAELAIATGAGYARSAVELGMATEVEAGEWLDFRRGAAARGTMVVGHRDLLAVPGDCC